MAEAQPLHFHTRKSPQIVNLMFFGVGIRESKKTAQKAYFVRYFLYFGSLFRALLTSQPVLLETGLRGRGEGGLKRNSSKNVLNFHASSSACRMMCIYTRLKNGGLILVAGW